MVNSLYFNDIKVLNGIYEILNTFVTTNEEIYNIYNKDIKIVDDDDSIIDLTYFPTIYYTIALSSPFTKTSDDRQIQNHTNFTTVIEIYTDGENRATNNRKISQLLIRELGRYNFKLLEQRADNAYTNEQSRRILRFQNIFDNLTETIIY